MDGSCHAMIGVCGPSHWCGLATKRLPYSPPSWTFFLFFVDAIGLFQAVMKTVSLRFYAVPSYFLVEIWKFNRSEIQYVGHWIWGLSKSGSSTRTTLRSTWPCTFPVLVMLPRGSAPNSYGNFKYNTSATGYERVYTRVGLPCKFVWFYGILLKVHLNVS